MGYFVPCPTKPSGYYECIWYCGSFCGCGLKKIVYIYIYILILMIFNLNILDLTTAITS
jgi:hypothetical protein